ncbi:MAG: DUF1905 domain-containing protein [Bdellovibrionales bacterium]|nr:DUF1905 domain-containing protein [Bdellovibrionales bacterium]
MPVAKTKKLSFQSKLESISDELEYYAVPVPAKITAALGTKASVPIVARINGSKPFRGSLYTVGGGRHSMRVKASVRKDVGIKEGDRVKVEISVVDRAAEAADLPSDLASALRSAGVRKDYDAIPPGARGFMLRKLEQAAKPETRRKRIDEIVQAAHARREKRVDRR